MMPPAPEEGAGGHDNDSPGIATAVYAERLPLAVTGPSETLEALQQAAHSDDELGTTPAIDGAPEVTATTGSEVIDADEFIEDADDTSNQEPADATGREFGGQPVNHDGIKDQFRAAGGTPSDAPPPPVETNTSSSLLDLKRKELQGRLKSDFDIILPDDIKPLTLLERIEAIVYKGSWPSDDETRRTLRVLMTCMDPETYERSNVFSGNLAALRRAFKAELDKRRKRDSAPNSNKKGPPPLPR